MIYVEYIERDRFMPMDVFMQFGRQSGWSSGEDRKIANLGRAERIAPAPSVICMWRNRGMARMDEWEESFRGEEAMRDPAAQAVRLAINFVEAGLYDEIVGGPPLGDGLHFVEFFAAEEEISDAEIRAHFGERAARYPDGRLGFVLRRIGLLGPDPGCLAVWTFPGYAAVEPIARERHGGHPLRPRRAGLYWNFETALI
jgi:hypothetical protein